MPARRGPWKRAFFEERKLTSALKHLILKRYVKEFAYHLGRPRGAVYYVDGFAGRGSYRGSDGTIEPGSPLLIAKLAETIRTSPTPFELRCLSVEEALASHRELERVTAPFAPHIVEKNYLGTFVDVLPDILARTRGVPAFFFIDPFGTKGIPFAKLRPIFGRTATTEVMITLHTDGIAKKAGYFNYLNDPDPRTRSVATALIGHLAAALHMSVPDLKLLWQGCRDTTEFERQILARYLSILRQGTGFNFVRACPIFYFHPHTPPGAEAPVCFYLVFATRNEKGLFELNDAVVGAVDEFYAQRNWDPLFPDFQRQVERTRDTQALKHQIVTKFASTVFTIQGVKLMLMQGDSPFLISGGDYRRAVLELSRARLIERMDGKTSTPSNLTPFRVKHRS